MEMNGHKCAGHVEIDKFANKSYEAMHRPKESEFFATDIRAVEPGDLPDADCYCFGFPCQAFSVAGKRGGFEDTRGTLFFEVMRLAAVRKPKYLFAENVIGLLSHNGGKTFGTIIATMGELGYDAEWQVLNSKDFGVPQNRERVFIIGHLRGSGTREVFPIYGETNEYSTVGESTKTTVSRTLTCGGHSGGNHSGMTIIKVKEATKQGYDIASEGDSINLSVPGSQTRRGRVGKGIANTLDTSCNQAVVISNTVRSGGRGSIDGKHNWDTYEIDGRIRRYTPRECFRLQGFKDIYFDRAAAVNSDTQLYKQAGNGVTVNVIYAIGKRLQ